jgi:hypothetical protein
VPNHWSVLLPKNWWKPYPLHSQDLPLGHETPTVNGILIVEATFELSQPRSSVKIKTLIHQLLQPRLEFHRITSITTIRLLRFYRFMSKQGMILFQHVLLFFFGYTHFSSSLHRSYPLIVLFNCFNEIS